MRKYFFTGLAILLPVVLTAAVIIFLVNLLTKPFVGLIDDYVLSSEALRQLTSRVPGMHYVIHYGAQIVVLLLLFWATALLGLIGRWFFFRSLIRMGDAVLHRIPFVNKLYKTTQDVIKSVFTDKSRSFKQVVMVPFPRDNTFSLGLVSSDAPPMCKAASKRDLLSVFLPTTPNPTSGYLLMFPREDCLFIDMKVEDAVKFIISCGVIHEGASTLVGEVLPEADPQPVHTEG